MDLPTRTVVLSVETINQLKTGGESESAFQKATSPVPHAYQFDRLMLANPDRLYRQ